MPLFLDTRGHSSLGIGICARCSRKFPLDELMADGNSPGLRVCAEDHDTLDPWRLPPPPPDQITLQYPRPDTPLYPFASIPIYVDAFFSVLGAGGLDNDGGVLVVTDLFGWQSQSGGLPGTLWSNGGVVNVNLPVVPVSAPAVIFGQISALGLLALGAGPLAVPQPLPGSKQIYVVGQELWVA